MAELNLDNEKSLRLNCLILAKGNIIQAQEYHTWIIHGVLPIKDRV